MIMNQFNSICNVINQCKKTILKIEQDFISAPNGIINVNENSDSPFLKGYHQSPTKLPYNAYKDTLNNTLSPILTNLNSPVLNGSNCTNNNTSGATPTNGLSVKLNINNNKKSQIYILVNIALGNINNCHDCIIVLGPCVGLIEISNCSKVTLISITKGIKIKSSNNISLFICSNEKPIISSDCHNIKLAPYNTHYPNLDTQIATSKLLVDLENNQWNNPSIFKLFSPLNSPLLQSNSPTTTTTTTTTTSDLLQIPPNNLLNVDDTNNIHEETTEIYSILDPEEFFPFVVPFLIKGKTKSNPCELPNEYSTCLANKSNSVHALHKINSSNYKRSIN
ncbi:hypothetical protein DICPUDRAFT_150298 [Dictyostelium purpureum]|uniref:C-CAP/cofactor C-like domain-containing protein n=1 Tax=Dictyostelium purpureum TaxID=5786 RepID=F0ZFZ2_DICPU|nr:uncharacterized protein DICPUDRAFT_150298 [Dictyostelium purpureum]EGC37124.1 hypothetical protein DICPUDRAFT_150298 [Dictyostelium purpureum]|eukprot:XP_003286327.1 hypothetical protein DICPUDRAFT_150298 [Dictyostelium purpureum]